MRLGMRKVEKERRVLCFLDKTHRPLGQSIRHLALIKFPADDLAIIENRKIRIAFHKFDRTTRPHVIRIRITMILVKSLIHRQKFFLIAEVPFSKGRCGVTLPLEKLGNRRFIGI